MELSDDTKQWLLGWARRIIDIELGGGEQPPKPLDMPEQAMLLGGCFVSLHETTGALRGCIGTFSAVEPLWENVRDMAVAASTRDPRFRPLVPSELAGCVLEISVLSPPHAVAAGDVEVGRHGVMLRKGHRRGVLLPQVATSRGWDRETFLDHTCLKAGLAAGDWRDGSVEIEVFTAEVFDEKTG